ncbi:MAG: hypothetical protein Ct9H90mP16_06420 [Candidatus Poseidoniales archaeon]|nr:MAG: hypothetical protein Ct9H90mP16_06420 [Candidatus Poseidoniales archaeon]
METPKKESSIGEMRFSPLELIDELSCGHRLTPVICCSVEHLLAWDQCNEVIMFRPAC